jgi:tripartite-type tricarboxylate transporter receptor subunit TctC
MTTMKNRTSRGTALAAILLSLAPWALGQEYPHKPLRVIVPYAAGGGADLLARLVSQELSQRLKQSVVVENQGGGSNTIGMRTVAVAPKDGYTLGLATPVFVMTPSLMKDQPYDPLKDFVPVGMIGSTPLVLCVHPSVQAKTVKEFVALAKAKPGSLNFASLGTSTTQGLAAYMFNFMTGIEAVEVPYKGSAPGTTDLLSGNVQYMFNALPSMTPHILAGKLRGLGVSGRKRSPHLPDVPPIIDTVPGYEVITWYSFVAPAGTPQAVVDRLNKELAEIVESPEMKKKLAEQGVDADAMTLAELKKLYADETAKWAKVIKDAKVKPQ